MGLEKIQHDLECDITMDELNYLISVSTDRMKNLLKLKYIDGLKYKEINDRLGIHTSEVSVRNWKSKVRCVINRIREAEKDYDNIGNLDVDMRIYRRLILYSNFYGHKNDRSISYINSIDDKTLSRFTRDTHDKRCKLIGEKRCKLIRKSIQRYYNGASNFSLKRIKSI